jgi:hypothetical protein
MWVDPWPLPFPRDSSFFQPLLLWNGWQGLKATQSTRRSTALLIDGKMAFKGTTSSYLGLWTWHLTWQKELCRCDSCLRWTEHPGLSGLVLNIMADVLVRVRQSWFDSEKEEDDIMWTRAKEWGQPEDQKKARNGFSQSLYRECGPLTSFILAQWNCFWTSGFQSIRE